MHTSSGNPRVALTQQFGKKVVAALIIASAVLCGINPGRVPISTAVNFVNQCPSVLIFWAIAAAFIHVQLYNFYKYDFIRGNEDRNWQFSARFVAASKDSVAINDDQRTNGQRDLQRISGERDSVVRASRADFCILAMGTLGLLAVPAALICWWVQHPTYPICSPMCAVTLLWVQAIIYLVRHLARDWPKETNPYPTKDDLDKAVAYYQQNEKQLRDYLQDNRT